MDRAAPSTVAVDLRALVPAPTGIGVYTRSLLLALAARGTTRYLGLAHRPLLDGHELTAAGIHLEHERAPLGVVWQQLSLPRRLARGDAELFWSPLMTLPMRSPLPGVVTIHDLTALLYPETHRLKVRWSLLPFLERSLVAARRIVSVSEATARDLRFHFPSVARKIRVIHHGVDPEFLPADPEGVAAVREELGCSEGYVLYAGTLEPRKNLRPLLDAWEKLRRERPDEIPPLVLVGPYGWHSRNLLRRMEQLREIGLVALGRVEREKLVRVFQGARVFVYPSLYEGFGLPPAEAMACGVPTVVSDASSLPEVVGEAGIKVEPGDSGGLADAIERILTNPELAADLAGRGLERVRHFRWERAAAEMEEVFGEAVGRDA